MIVQKDFLNKLKDFGLNSYEAKLWVALLSRGVSTAGELSDIANVPRSRSYDVLESLEKKGFVIMKLGKPIKYIAVPPSEVIERVKKKVQEDSDKQIKIIESLKETDVLSELDVLHRQGVEMVDPTEISGSIKGRDNLYNQLEAMIKGAENTIVIMTTEDGLRRKAELLKKQMEKAKKKGVKIKIAAPITSSTSEIVNQLSQVADVRHCDEKARFCVVDGKQVAFMLLDDKNVHPAYDAAIWANTEFFAQTLEKFFNDKWESLKQPKPATLVIKR
ncbi:MAG: helix-turn-helix domain-containing protein [Candidatus Woesearchaeota archaeon]